MNDKVNFRPLVNKNSHWIDAQDGTRIAEVYNHAPYYTAYAQLLATSPKLLYALEQILTHVNVALNSDGDVFIDEVFIANLAEDAIKEARKPATF